MPARRLAAARCKSAPAGRRAALGGPITNNGTLAFYRSNDFSCSDNIGGSGGLIKYAANRLTLTGTNSYAGRTVVAGGTLELAASAQSCVTSGGGADIRTGKIVFDYAGSSDPVGTIQGLLSYSCDNGQWDRGQFRDTTAAATGLTLGLYDDTAAKTVTVMATYPGDFNLDGVVNNAGQGDLAGPCVYRHNVAAGRRQRRRRGQRAGSRPVACTFRSQRPA